MTARDERLEAAVKALREQGYDGPTAYRYAAAGIIVGDAVRAFDEQQTVRHLADRQRQSNAVQETQPPAASPVGADPPWIDEAAYEARKAWSPHAIGRWMTIARAVLRFAASQPPGAEEIEAAGKEIVARLHLEELSLDTEQRIASAALLAAARVRAGG